MDTFLQKSLGLIMKSGFLFVVLILSKVAVSLSVRGRLPATSHIGCRSRAFHIFNGVSLKSLLISPYLKPVYLPSDDGPSRLLYSSLSKEIDRELYQIFRTDKTPMNIERLFRDFITTRINSLELEHIAELLFAIALNRKLRIDIPFQLLTKRMKDIGVKTLSMETLRKLLYGLRTISTGKTVVGLSTYQREKL